MDCPDYVERALGSEAKGLSSHMVLGKSLPFWASVALSGKTTKCQRHLQDRRVDE